MDAAQDPEFQSPSDTDNNNSSGAKLEGMSRLISHIIPGRNKDSLRPHTVVSGSGTSLLSPPLWFTNDTFYGNSDVDRTYTHTLTGTRGSMTPGFGEDPGKMYEILNCNCS